VTRRRLPAPRWQTPLPPTVVGSWGPEVAWWAAHELGITLDRWQRRALNRALAVDANGTLVYRHYLVSTARQMGKTVVVRSLIGWALTAADTPPWERILGLAHDRRQARIPYDAVRQDLMPLRRRYPHAGLALTRYLGIRSDLYGRHREYDIGSRESRNVIRGTTNDLGIFDEVRTQINYETWAALEPTTRARPDPLIIGLSTAGDDRSILLRDWWERGLRIIDGAEPSDGFGMTWYAAPDELAPDDPRAILAANPAIAEGRLPIGPVLASIRSLSPSAYRAETLNLWTEGIDEWLPPGLWAERVAEQPAEHVRVVLAAEAVPTWRRVTVTVALVTDAGAWVGVAGELDSARSGASSIAPAELVALVGRLSTEWGARELAYSAAAAAAPHLTAWAEAANVRAIPMGARQIRAASSLFRSELIGGRLTHADDPLLAQQVRAARPSGPLEGGDWYFSLRASLGEIDALRAAAWASWAAIAPPEVEVPVQVF
jgi:phage terminase large subunit-like protein